MHFLVSAIGSAGDVHPFIAVGAALRGRGHEVRIVASAVFESRVRRAGLGFAPLGTVEEYERLLQRPQLWQPRAGARMILGEVLRRLPETVAALRDALPAPDTVLVGGTLSWGLRLLQEQTGLPGATVHLSPMLLPSAFDPPVLAGLGDLSRVPRRLRGWLQGLLERLVLDPAMRPTVNAVRMRFGLPPLKRVWRAWTDSPDLVVGAWPSWFAPPQPDWPPQAVATGFPLHAEADVPLAARTAAFLDAGPPPVGITPGSANAHGAALFARALEACAALGRRALVVTPYRDQLPEPLPSGVHHAAYEPFARLLPRLSAVVHHGGIGTSAQALAAGVPQLVSPFAHDQFDNAARLRRLGVAKTVRPSDTVADWTAALRGLMHEPAVAAAVGACAARIAGERPGSDAIADRLEQLARRVPQRAAARPASPPARPGA